jgi:amino acid transporter
VHWSAFSAPPSPAPGEQAGLVGAAFAGLFATTGFEYVPVPAGEAEDPRRSMALVMPVSVVGATLLYVLIQVVAAGTLPTLGASSRPLVDAARAFSGPRFGEAIAVVAALSALGFCSSSAMVAPRYLAAFAEDAFLPRILAHRTRRYDSPLVAIAVVTLLVTLLSSSLSFTALADISNIAVVAQYLSTSLAVFVWRKRPRDEHTFRLPFGFVIPVLASVGSVLFLWQVSRGELIFGCVLGGVGLALGIMTRTWSRRMK